MFGWLKKKDEAEFEADYSGWTYYLCILESREASVFVNLNANDAIDELPNQIVTAMLSYRETYETGMPTNTEFDVVSAIEDAIFQSALSLNDRYVGRITTNGTREFYIYSHNVDKLGPKLMKISKKFGYELEIRFSNDADHTDYVERLYPSDDDWQIMRDMRVLDNLASHGDNSEIEREIDHHVYMPDFEKAEAFQQWALAEGFRSGGDIDKTDEGQFVIHLCYTSITELTEISQQSLRLSRKALQFGGNYDGWGTHVVKGDEA